MASNPEYVRMHDEAAKTETKTATREPLTVLLAFPRESIPDIQNNTH